MIQAIYKDYILISGDWCRIKTHLHWGSWFQVGVGGFYFEPAKELSTRKIFVLGKADLPKAVSQYLKEERRKGWEEHGHKKVVDERPAP